MTNTSYPTWITVSRVVVAGVLLISCGSYFIYDGLLTLAAGETLIAGKHIQPFVASASGPNSGAFYFHIYGQLVFSSLLVLAGFALPASLLLMRSKLRAATLNLFGSSAGSTLGHAPWVAALAVSLVLAYLLVRRVLENS
jgi:hypothetical protein